MLYDSWKKTMDKLPSGIAILKCDMAIYHNQKNSRIIEYPRGQHRSR